MHTSPPWVGAPILSFLLVAACSSVETLPAYQVPHDAGGGGTGGEAGPACGGVDEACCPNQVCDDPDGYHPLVCHQDRCRSREWALWPMPNPPSTGLPNPQSYTPMGETVLDNVTGLTWQQASSPVQLEWQEARDYCRDIDLDGGGFRLPTRIELVSLLDYTKGLDPAIDETVFQAWAELKDAYWTGTTLSAGQRWIVSFHSGTVLVTGGPAWVRCVR